MKKALIGLAAGAVLTISAGTASADGYAYGSVKDAAPVQQVNWNGLYLGAAVGYGIANTDISGYSYTEVYDGWSWGDENFAAIAAKGLSSDGAQGTITLGYDRQIHPGLLVGVFGDYTFGDLENETWMGGYSYDDWDEYSWFEPARLRTKIGNNWSIGGRIGLVRENTLWYVFAGYAQADLDWNLTSYFDYDPVGEGSGSEKLKGYFLGLGVEHQLFQNVSLKLEYRYTDYDKVTFGGSNYGYVGVDHESEFRADTDIHSVRLGVNWKVDLFGGRHGAPAYESLK